jgi:hypothetical protein
MAKAEANTALSLSLPVAGTSMVFIIDLPDRSWFSLAHLNARGSALIEINNPPSGEYKEPTRWRDFKPSTTSMFVASECCCAPI